MPLLLLSQVFLETLAEHDTGVNVISYSLADDPQKHAIFEKP